MLVGGRAVRRSSWHAFGAGGLTLMGLLVSLQAMWFGRGETDEPGQLLWGLLALATWWAGVAWYWWASSVVLDDGGLYLRGPFRSQRIAWHEIADVQVVGAPGYEVARRVEELRVWRRTFAP